MGTDGLNFENARVEVARTWASILTVTERSPGLGFRPLAARLLILKIIEGEEFYTITAEAFESDTAKRIAQIQNAWTESAKTVPVGVVFVGKATDRTNNFLDDVVLVPDAVSVAANLLDADVTQLICALSNDAAVFASRMLVTLGIGADGCEDVITEIP